jgi:hypothetical protein
MLLGWLTYAAAAAAGLLLVASSARQLSSMRMASQQIPRTALTVTLTQQPSLCQHQLRRHPQQHLHPCLQCTLLLLVMLGTMHSSTLGVIPKITAMLCTQFSHRGVMPLLLVAVVQTLHRWQQLQRQQMLLVHGRMVLWVLAGAHLQVLLEAAAWCTSQLQMAGAY